MEADKLRLQEKVCSLSTPLPSSSRASKRPLEELSDKQQRRCKQQRVQQCEDALGFLQKEGIVPTKIEFLDMGSGRTETIELNADEVEAMFGPDPMMTQDDEDQINMMLFVKDRYDLSQDAYHEMAKICKEMPRHYLLKRRVAELNKLWNIKPTPNGTCGVQQTLEDRLRVRVSHLHKTAAADAKFQSTKELNVKLADDGTNIGKRLHVINFTFTLLDEGSLAHSCDGNHTLAIFKKPEKYKYLHDTLEDIRSEVETLKMNTVDGVVYKINYFLGGDWKFLAIVTGIDSATSTYACIWCKCLSTERCLMDKQWSIVDSSKGARSIEESIKLSEKLKSQRKFNVTNRPLFPSIPLSNVVIDKIQFKRSSKAVQGNGSQSLSPFTRRRM